MKTYIKYGVAGNQKKKAEKFGLKWDYIKKSWYTTDMDSYLELKRLDNLRIMNNQKNIYKKLKI